MIARIAAAIALGAALAVGAGAQETKDPTALDVPAWTQRLVDLNAACGADRASAACAVAATAVQSDMARAVTILSKTGREGGALEVARRLMSVPVPGVQTAATYALARLGPEPSDTPLLAALLADPNPSLRRAAFGALKASPDPAARPWAERAQPQARGERWWDDRRAMDEATLGVALPPGAAPVYFEMKAWMDGGQVFTADGTPDEVLAHFAGIAGSPVRPLAEVEAWFASDEKMKPILARYANTAWYGDARVVALADGTGDHAGKPVRLAIVWQDQQLGKTGFALQWAPVDAMPGRNQPPWSGDAPKIEKLDEAKLGDPGTLLPPALKPGAEDEDTHAYMAVALGDGAGALAYLETFPDGAYRAEVEAIIARPRVWLPEVNPTEPTEVRIAFANMPTDEPLRFDLISLDQLRSDADYRGPSGPIDPTEDIQGQAQGEVVWKTSTPLKAGLYLVRAFKGERKMDFDGVSLRRFVQGENAFVHRTIRVLPRVVNLALDKQDYAPQETVTITYSDMPAAGSPGIGSPFVTIVKAGARARDWGQYVYTEDRTSGSVTMEAPTAPGAYEVRALFAEDGVVHGVAPFTVGGPVAAPDPAAPAPAAPGPAAPVPTAESDIKITLAKESFAPQEPIVVTISGLPGNPKDYVSVVPADSIDGATFRWVYTGGVKEGTFTLPGVDAGKWEIRVRFNDEYVPERARLAFEVK